MEFWFVLGGLILIVAVIAALVTYRKRRQRGALDPSAAEAATASLRFRSATHEKQRTQGRY